MSQIAICIVTNKINDKSFVFKSRDSSKRWDRFKKQLDKRSFYNQNLQEDWNKYGCDNFLFEIKEIINENSEVDELYNQIIDSLNQTYNFNDYSYAFQIPLESVVKQLKNRFIEKIGETEFTTNFRLKLNKFDLDDEDGFKIKNDFIKQIESGEVNYTNFDDKLNSILEKYSKNKQEKLKEEHEILLINYLEKLDNSNFDDFDLNYNEIYQIRLDIKKAIHDEKLNNTNEIHDEFIKLGSKINNKKIYKKECLDILHEEINSREFNKKMKSKGLTISDKIIIQKRVENLIEKDKITKYKIKDKVNNLLNQRVGDKRKEIKKNKEDLKNEVYLIIGNENLNEEFSNKLKDKYLHENVAYEILIEMFRLIDNNSITNDDEITLKINSLIKQKEVDDVNKRLNELTSADINKILKMNKIHVLGLRKSTKIDKIISSLSLDLIRKDIRDLGYFLKIKHVNNPYIIYCQHCGSKIYYDQKFCQGCGTKL